MKIKREAQAAESDVNKTPQKKAKVEGGNLSPTIPMKWTVEDAKLIKNLRDEKIGWKYYRPAEYH